MNVDQLKKFYENKKGAYEKTLSDVKSCKRQCRKLKRSQLNLHSAREFVLQKAKQTQEALEYQISDLVTFAMSLVFEDPYKLVLEFTERRGSTEADIYFERDGSKVDPVSSSGGGAVDIASFALRLSFWALQVPRSRNTMILDEPLKWLKGGELPHKGSEMIKSISEKLDLQIIMVSHQPELIDSADNFIEVKKKKGVSIII